MLRWNRAAQTPKMGAGQVGTDDMTGGVLTPPQADAVDMARDADAGLPQFRFIAPDLSLQAGALRSSAGQSLRALQEAFTPTQPKRSMSHFAGRRRMLARVVAALDEWKAHVVIFGDRGVGKSSLANIVVEIARQAGITVLEMPCSSDTTFEWLFRTLLRQIPLPFRPQGSGTQDAGMAGLLPSGRFGPVELTAALKNLKDQHIIIRLDEFDRVQDQSFRQDMAETIKHVSDAGVSVSFLIVGVSDDLESLLGHHASLQRNLVGVHLPLMTGDEIDAVIDQGERGARLRFQQGVREQLAFLSRGLPYQVQLLCLHAGQSAIARQSPEVAEADLMRAVAQSVTLAPRSIEAAYERFFEGPEKHVERKLALIAACSPFDSHGYFSADETPADAFDDTTRPLTREAYARFLELLSEPRSGPVFRVRKDQSGVRYAFASALTGPYVLARALLERDVAQPA